MSGCCSPLRLMISASASGNWKWPVGFARARPTPKLPSSSASAPAPSRNTLNTFLKKRALAHAWLWPCSWVKMPPSKRPGFNAAPVGLKPGGESVAELPGHRRSEEVVAGRDQSEPNFINLRLADGDQNGHQNGHQTD